MENEQIEPKEPSLDNPVLGRIYQQLNLQTLPTNEEELYNWFDIAKSIIMQESSFLKALADHNLAGELLNFPIAIELGNKENNKFPDFLPFTIIKKENFFKTLLGNKTFYLRVDKNTDPEKLQNFCKQILGFFEYHSPKED